jgi:hypothetical protein
MMVADFVGGDEMKYFQLSGQRCHGPHLACFSERAP